MVRRVSVAALAVLMASACASTESGSAAPEPCRACLSSALVRAAIAMAGNQDPHPYLLAEDVRITEDGVEIEPGQGIWAEQAVGSPPLQVLDTRENVAISFQKVRTGAGSQALVVMRVKNDDLVTEIEIMAVRTRTEGMIFQPENISIPSFEMTDLPPEGTLNTREEMIEIASRYPEGLKVGSFVTTDVPFAPEAYRFENGQLMAGPGCSFIPGCDDIKNQRLPTLAGISYYVAGVDEELGIVVLRMDFGPGSLFPSPDRPEGMTLSVFEAFKIWGGQVHAVEAFMEAKPGDAPLGWEP
jgi:hypothetical protein